MNVKKYIKPVIDILMTLALLILSGYQFWGESAHEWVDAGMFLLFIAHNILNLNWYKSIFKGKYSAMRIMILCVDCLTLISMLTQIYSGIVISRYVFNFLPINSGLAFARKLHILGAYWGFLIMSFHLGLHWNMIIRITKKSLHIKELNKIGTGIMNVIGLIITGYGVYAFVKRDFFKYLFLKSQFVFLDYSEPKIAFYFDLLAIMGACIFIAYHSLKLFSKRFT